MVAREVLKTNSVQLAGMEMRASGVRRRHQDQVAEGNGNVDPLSGRALEGVVVARSAALAEGELQRRGIAAADPEPDAARAGRAGLRQGVEGRRGRGGRRVA